MKTIKPTSDKLIPKNEKVINEIVTIVDIQEFKVALMNLAKKANLHPIMVTGIRIGLEELEKRLTKEKRKKQSENLKDVEKPKNIENE